MRTRADAAQPGEVSGDAAGSSDVGVNGDAAKIPDLGADTADASSRVKYSGLVVAFRRHEGATTSYAARAVFTDWERPVIGGCPNCCCGGTDRGLPYPIKPPDADKNGQIQLSRLTISTVTNGNAIIDLVGAEVQAGPLTVE
jgi:hypothetical protein